MPADFQISQSCHCRGPPYYTHEATEKAAQIMIIQSKYGDAATQKESSLAHLKSCLHQAQGCSSTMVKLEHRLQLSTSLELDRLVTDLKQCYNTACEWSFEHLFTLE